MSRREALLCGAGLVGGLAAGGRQQALGAPRRAPSREPGYLRLEREGVLAQRERELWRLERARACCPRRCDRNRKPEEPRLCGSSERWVKVSSAHPHFGEERPLVGRYGSGTIFFSNCSLLCRYCQNFEIAHLGLGTEIDQEELAGAMLHLQGRGCHNINLVTPTHVMAHVVSALRLAIPRGLRLPLVYNTGGYDRLEVIRLLDGVVDIYMPDFKYQDAAVAAELSLGAEDYPTVARAAILEMHRQVGVLELCPEGVAQRGVILRHLVLPHNLAGTDRFVRWVAQELGPETYVNLMDQYHPAFRAQDDSCLNRILTQEEWRQALGWAAAAGLGNLDGR